MLYFFKTLQTDSNELKTVPKINLLHKTKNVSFDVPHLRLIAF